MLTLSVEGVRLLFWHFPHGIPSGTFPAIDGFVHHGQYTSPVKLGVEGSPGETCGL